MTPLKLSLWFRSIWSERDGSGSSTRVNCSLLIFAGIWMAVYLVWKNHSTQHLPDVAIFVSTIAGLLYGTNRFFNAKDAANKKGPDVLSGPS